MLVRLAVYFCFWNKKKECYRHSSSETRKLSRLSTWITRNSKNRLIIITRQKTKYAPNEKSASGWISAAPSGMLMINRPFNSLIRQGAPPSPPLVVIIISYCHIDYIRVTLLRYYNRFKIFVLLCNFFFLLGFIEKSSRIISSERADACSIIS